MSVSTASEGVERLHSADANGAEATAAAPLRILVDALNTKAGQGGLLTYSSGAVNGLALQPSLSLLVLTSDPDAFDGQNVEIYPAPRSTQSFAKRVLWRERTLRRIIRSASIDVLFSTSPEMPLSGPAKPAAMMLHDVGPVVAPGIYPRAKHLRFRLLLPRACATASTIICLSTHTKNEVVRAFGIDPARCEVVGGAAQDLGHVPRLPAAERTSPFFLLVGSLFGHKNTETIFRAWPGVRDDCQARGVQTPRLVLTGPISGAERHKLMTLAGEAGITDFVAHRGFVSKPELARLYSQCEGLLFPSLYEGLGLPVLEAMNAGAPVIASSLPPVQELGRGTILLVEDITSPREWAARVVGVLRDPAEATRRAEMARGQSESHTWDGVGRELSRVLWMTSHKTRCER